MSSRSIGTNPKVAGVHKVLAQANFEQDTSVLSPRFLSTHDWVLNEHSFPILDVTFLGTRPLRVRFTCDNWNDLPPSAELLEQDGAAVAQALPGGVFNPSAHPKTGRQFVCMRGIREFHEHPSHIQEQWDTHRGKDGMDLVGLMIQLSHAWRKAVGR